MCLRIERRRSRRLERRRRREVKGEEQSQGGTGKEKQPRCGNCSAGSDIDGSYSDDTDSEDSDIEDVIVHKYM